MREILLKPDLYKFHTFHDFTKTFPLDHRDLILTTGYLYDTFVKPHGKGVPFLRQDDFGAGEPTEEMLEAIFSVLDYDSYDRVIAIGGGTVIDIGKMLTVRRTGTVNDLFFKRTELIREKKLIAIPTTCGTGSEVTSTSVAIVRDESGATTKLGLLSEGLIADTACLIPEFLTGLSHQAFSEALIDALIHAVEAFLSPNRATMTTDLFAKAAIEVILKGFRMAEQGCDIKTEYGEELLTASCYAGIAFLQAGCGTVHGLSYPLSGAYLVTHGASNYAFFEKVLETYEKHKPDGKLCELKTMICHIFECAADQALSVLAQAEEHLIPVKKLREYGVREKDLSAFTKSVFINQRRLVDNSYIPLTEEMVEEIYRQVY